jgi:putative aldouronate transport system permease protein
LSNELASTGYLVKKGTGKGRIKKVLKDQWPLYLMVLPGIAYFVIFKFVPILGSVIAFQDYDIARGIFESPFVGFKHFIAFFKYYNSRQVFINTLIIATYSLIFTFPAPIILALSLNEVKNGYFKKIIQSVSYLPHFFSWVIIAGLTFDLLSLSGLVNVIRTELGKEAVLYMQKASYFRFIVVCTSLWKETGWGSIVILAAISNINPEYYESAIVDGAGRLKRMIYITIPLLMPTVTILLLLRIGSFIELNFDQIMNLITPMTYSKGDVIDTYIYRVGIGRMEYSATTAVGLFQSVIGFLLVLICNSLSTKYTGRGLW